MFWPGHACKKQLNTDLHSLCSTLNLTLVGDRRNGRGQEPINFDGLLARRKTNINRELKQLRRRQQRVCGLTILFVENKIDNIARASQLWLPLFAVTLNQFSNAAFYGERDGMRPCTLREHQC